MWWGIATVAALVAWAAWYEREQRKEWQRMIDLHNRHVKATHGEIQPLERRVKELEATVKKLQEPPATQQPTNPAPQPSQAVLEFAGSRAYQRPLWTYSQAQLTMLCHNMREYANQRKAYNKGDGPCPKVREVFPPTGSHLKQCLVPHVIDEDRYKAWKNEGRWPVFLTHPTEQAVNHLRVMTKTA